MGTSRGYGGSANSKYGGGSSGYGGSGSSYLNSSYGAPRSSYRQSSYEPRLSSYVGGGSVMDRVKQIGNPDTRSSAGSYTPLSSRRASGRDYGGGGGGNSWDKYSRSGGSDYSAGNSVGNRSGYMSDYGGSTPSLYGSWDRTSSIGRYGGASRETSPVSTRAPVRQYDYSSSASPSPYSTYRRPATETRSPSVSNRYERQNSRTNDVYEESPSRPRRKWESDVYGVTPSRQASRETLPEPVKAPQKDYSSDSEDSNPEDDKRGSKYLMSRGTSPMPEPGKRDRRSKDVSSVISKNKRVKKETPRGRNRYDPRRRRLVDCSTQTNLDEPGASRRNRDRRVNRDDMAKLAALAMLKDGEDTTGDGYKNNRDKFQQANSPMSPPATNRGGEEKSWRQSVYGEEPPPPAPLSRLKHYQTEEDLRLAVDGHRRVPQVAVQDGESTESPDDRPAQRDRRSYNEKESGKRRSQNDSDSKRRSSSRDSMLDDKPNRSRRQRTSSRELLDESEPSQHSGRTTLTPDSLSLRDSIEKVQSWKQKLPPDIHDNRLKVDTRDTSGFPRSDSGEYFSAQSSHDSGRQYKEKMYAQQHSPRSPQYEDPFSDREEDVLSPGGSRRRRVRRHLSREMSQESFDEERTHHPVNKEKLRKSELNRNAENERKELEDLERRRRVYAGEDPGAVDESLRKRRPDNSSETFFRDESPSRRRSKYSSRHNSREDLLDDKRQTDKRPRKDKRGSDAHASDSSQFGFNKEGSPNRLAARANRRSRHSSQEGILDEATQYLRPHSMVMSNESLAKLSGAGSIQSMHSALTDDGTIRNGASMQSLDSNELQEIPSSGGSLPDIVPGEKAGQISKGKKSKQNSGGGLIGRTGDIDNLLNFSPNEEDFVEKGRGVKEIKRNRAHILDQPVPRDPSPLRPQNSGKFEVPL